VRLKSGGIPVLLDVRTYHVKPNTMKPHMDLYAEHGFPVQKKHLGEPLAYLTTESGADVNCYIHIWVYENAADRERKRAAMIADPAWHRWQEMSAQAGYLVKQENRLMSPTAFAPIKR
jgi:hypothetical protein